MTSNLTWQKLECTYSTPQFIYDLTLVNNLLAKSPACLA